MKNKKTVEQAELEILCTTVRKLVEKKEYENCIRIICEAMARFPNSAAPHNLLGLVLEGKGEHIDAMKHFRAACALEPTYTPAGANLRGFSSCFSKGTGAFDESDVHLPSYQEEYLIDQKRYSHKLVEKRVKR